MVERRAVEAVIWGVPAVNYDLMDQQMLRLGGKPNQIVYWSGLLDWRNQTLTPNPDVIYLMAFFNTKDGPMVIEIPPAGDGVINGSIMDPWQAALEDVGPAGADKGAGGKYLILPPGYQGTVPDGFIALPSANYQGYALLRSILKSGSEADVQTAVAYGRRIKLYPSQPGGRSARDGVPRRQGRGLRCHDPLRPSLLPVARPHSCSRSPGSTRDKAMIDPLKSLGIEKGKPFNPDETTQGILDAAAREAQAWLGPEIRDHVPALLRRAPVGVSHRARGDRRPSEPVRRPGQLPGRRPRRHLHDGVLQHQAFGDRPVLSDDDQGQGRPDPSTAATPIAWPSRRTCR